MWIFAYWCWLANLSGSAFLQKETILINDCGSSQYVSVYTFLLFAFFFLMSALLLDWSYEEGRTWERKKMKEEGEFFTAKVKAEN